VGDGHGGSDPCTPTHNQIDSDSGERSPNVLAKWGIIVPTCWWHIRLVSASPSQSNGPPDGPQDTSCSLCVCQCLAEHRSLKKDRISDFGGHFYELV
jgi:hypothetical protein